MNNTFVEISNELKMANTVLLYPHINMDGDTLGSAVALCIAIRKMGKECHVLIEDEIPKNLQFMDKGYCTFDKNIIANPDISICIDCGDIDRFEKRKYKFISGRITICIDHHGTTQPFCNFNYIDSKAAATGELIYKLLQTMDVECDAEMGEALYAAITTDTGNFQYSNTTKETHNIVANLYDWGIDSNKISVEIYENVRLEKITIQNRAISTMCTIAGGKGAIAYVTKEMLAQTGATMDETEGVVESMRSISGVEIAAFLKEEESDKIKVSLRAKRLGDVSKIASLFNGGGHTKAAGCTIRGNITEAFDLIEAEIIKNLENI